MYWVPSSDRSNGRAAVRVGERPSSTLRSFSFGEFDPRVTGADSSFVVAFGDPPADDDEGTGGETGSEPGEPSTNVGGWPQLGRDTRLTSVSSQTLPDSRPEPDWTFEAQNDLTGPPMVANGRAFVSTDAGSLLAIDAATGEQLWSYYSVGEDQRMYREYQPLVIDDTVFTIGGSGHLHAVDAATGTSVWTYRDAAVETPPVQINECIAVTTDEPAAVEIDPTSGDVAEMTHGVSLEFPPSGSSDGIWWVSQGEMINGRYLSSSGQLQFAESGGQILTPVASRQNSFYVGGGHGAFGKNDDSEWLVELPDLVRAKPAVTEEYVYTADMSGVCVGIDRATGDEQWRRSIDGTVLQNPVVAGDSFVVRTRGGGVHVLDTSTGELRWSIHAADGESSGWGDLSVHADAVSTARGWLYYADERELRGYQLE